MNTPALPTFATINQALTDSHIMINPSLLHGIWCGLIVGGQYCDPQDWLEIAVDESHTWKALDTQVQILLLQLAEQSVFMMAQSDFGFNLLLPADEEPLAERAYALSEWCIGFVEGIQNQQDQQTLLTGDGAQALADLTKISEMDFDPEESEDEETSYMELVEFIRVAVMLIHQNLLEGHHSDPIILPTHLN
ncbi:MAG TPA: UPF0149 family protein [Gammaproteobacteria bacterium]|nr:UPF0149 family protein [Gammaproteobacteria bacterium]